MKGRTRPGHTSKTRSKKDLKRVPRAQSSYTGKRNIGHEKCSGFDVKIRR